MAFARPTTVRVWAGISERGRCRRCHKTIFWRTRMDTGRGLPLDPGFTVRETGRDAREHLYHLLSFEDVHKCAQRPAKAKPPTPSLF